MRKAAKTSTTQAVTRTSRRALKTFDPNATVDAKLRARIEVMVEKMITVLDSLEDTDQDAAVDDDPIDDDEREIEDENDEDNGDAEPSLGSSQVAEWSSQELWAAPSFARGTDLEDEHDGREPESY